MSEAPLPVWMRVEPTTISYADVMIDDLSLQDLIDNGLLWAINTTVFHPRGMALAIDLEMDTIALLATDGTECIAYGDASEMDDKFRRFESLVKAMREQAQRIRAEHGTLRGDSGESSGSG